MTFSQWDLNFPLIYHSSFSLIAALGAYKRHKREVSKTHQCWQERLLHGLACYTLHALDYNPLKCCLASTPLPYHLHWNIKLLSWTCQMSIKLNSTLCIFVQNTWGRKSLGRITFPISPEDIYPPSTISNLSFINLLIEYHSKCPKSHISQWSHIPILFDLKADFHLHPPEAAKLEAKERRRGRGEQIFLISVNIFSSGLHTVPLAIVDSFSRRGLAHLWALSWLFSVHLGGGLFT